MTIQTKHLLILAALLLVVVLAVAFGSMLIFSKMRSLETERDTRIEMLERSNKQLVQEIEDGDKREAQRLKELEARKQIVVKDSGEALKVLQELLPSLRQTPASAQSDSLPSAPSATRETGARGDGSIIVTPAQQQILAARELTCRECETKLANAEEKLAKKDEIIQNKDEELASERKARGAGFWNRAKRVLIVTGATSACASLGGAVRGKEGAVIAGTTCGGVAAAVSR